MYPTGKKPKKFYAVRKPMPLTRRRRDFKFMEHECCEGCSVLERALVEENPTKFKITDDAILMFDQSPYMVPLFLEFKRKNETDDDCGYLTPCGVELYDYASIYRYLKATKSRLNVNQFVLTARIELFRDHPEFKVGFKCLCFSRSPVEILCQQVLFTSFATLIEFVVFLSGLQYEKGHFKRPRITVNLGDQ